MRALMEKVRVQSDRALAAHYPQAWPAKVTVEARTARYEKLALHVPGDPQRPFARRDVEEKFDGVVRPLFGERAANELFDAAIAALGDRSALRAVLRTLHAEQT
jgi:2-methylcitrate dehydratase PrpD